MKRKFKSKEHREWREKVLTRDDFTCQVCKKQSNKGLNAHHIIPSNFKEYEWDPDNGLILCAGCHTLGMYSAHKNPLWFYNWMKSNKPHLHNLAEARLRRLITK